MKSKHIGKFDHIGWEHVLAAIKEFDSKGREAMLKKYECNPSTKWYIRFKGRFYDQKLIIHAAHAHTGRESCLEFQAKESRRYLGKFEFRVVEGCCKTADHRSAPRG